MVQRPFMLGLALCSALAGLVLGSESGNAQAPGLLGMGGATSTGPYIRLDSGYSFSEKLSADFLNRTAGDSYIVGGGAGFQFTPNLRADVTVGYRGDFKNTASATSPLGTTDAFGAPLFLTTNTSTPIRALPVLVNGYVDLGKVLWFVPYVGGGIGFSRNETRSTGVSNTASSVNGSAPVNTGILPGATQTSFAWQVGAGTAIEITPSIKVDVGYRYVHFGDVHTADVATFSDGTTVSGATMRATLTAHEIQAGVRVGF
jgi:opacity protein-like surface antigen